MISTGVNPCFWPSPPLVRYPDGKLKPDTNWKSIECTGRFGRVLFFVRKSRHSHFFLYLSFFLSFSLSSSLSLARSLCLCCCGKIHGKAFDSPGDLFVPSAMRRGYLTLNRRAVALWLECNSRITDTRWVYFKCAFSKQINLRRSVFLFSLYPKLLDCKKIFLCNKIV